MLALHITDLKDFTNKLFVGQVFDHFWLTEATITTHSTFSIDGNLQMDFFDSDEQEILRQSRRTCSLWKEVKPLCCSMIRGRHTPLQFKIVLQLPYQQMTAILNQHEGLPDAELIQGLYLNLQYKNKTLLCTAGTSLKTFLPEKQLAQLWDDMVLHFLSRQEIAFEKL